MERKNNRNIYIIRLALVLMLPLVLTLSLLPCCPTFDTCPDETEHACEDEPEQGTVPSMGICSPFYTCGSCPGFILQALVFSPLPFKEISKAVLGDKQEFTPFSLAKSLFKPPQG
ncbi:hypothetical protein [Echinicola sediminis]